MKKYIVSVDLGQVDDWTAISILEEQIKRTTRPTIDDVRLQHEGDVKLSRTWWLKYLHRPEKGTKYTDIVKKIKTLMDTPELKDDSELVVDGTGVGRPVVDMMLEYGLKPIPVVFTAGNHVNLTDDTYHVPKRDIAGALRMAFDTGKIKIINSLPEVEALLKECQAFTGKINAKTGNVSFEAWRERDHDDMVFSLAMGIWWGAFTRKDITWNEFSRRKKKVDYDPLTH